MRLAWFSPWPPQTGDAAGRSATATAALAARGFAIDVFVDETRCAVARVETTAPPAPGQVRVLGAHDVVWRHARAPYDLAVYHLADTADHAYVWAYLFRRPGLTVLHDGRLHQSRSRALLADGRRDDYRAEFMWNHPGVAAAAAELAVNGYEGAFSCQWPMVRTALAASRLTLTHAEGALDDLRETAGAAAVEYVPASDGGSLPADDREVRARARARLGWPDTAVVFGVFDALSPDRRVPQILRAFASVRAHARDARLVLAGPRDPSLDVPALVGSLDLAGIVDVIDAPGSLDARDVTTDAAIAASDIVLSLRWPAALDTPSSWLRALAAARATVLLDLIHQAGVPALDPRTWRRHAPHGPGEDAHAVTVALDVMDEDHSLRLALQRLATDASLRARLGRAGRAYWERRHAPASMIEGYAAAIARTATLAPLEVALPAHLRPDPLALAGALIEPFGEAVAGPLRSLGASESH